MKKFFTVVALQPNGVTPCVYQAMGNSRLQMDCAVGFPILTAINGYVEKGETIRIIALIEQGNDKAKLNFKALETQVDVLQEKIGFLCTGVEPVGIAGLQDVRTHVDSFQKLLDYIDDDDELFGCITYGTKPQSMALKLALQYGYRVNRNVRIACLVYGKVDHRVNPIVAEVYDETALIQLDEIVHMLADRKVSNPKERIISILSM